MNQNKRQYSRLDKAPVTALDTSCTNRLLTILVVFSTIHTIFLTMTGFGVLMAYEDHKDDIQQISAIDWGATASSASQAALALDAQQLTSILKNAENATTGANSAIRDHGSQAFENFHQFSDKAMENKELFTDVRKSMIAAREPLREIAMLFDTGARGDLKSSFKLLHLALEHLNEVPWASIMKLIQEVFELAKKDLNPKNVEEIVEFANKMNKFMSPNETKTLKDITQSTDKALRDTDKILNQIFNLDGRKRI